MKITFINANRDARFNSYLPEAIAEALLRQIRQNKSSADGVLEKTSRAKQNATNSADIGGTRDDKSPV